MTSHNVIANLAKMKVETAVFGCCGNDNQGKIAIDSLKKLNVNTENITILNNTKTRLFHVSYTEENSKIVFSSKKRCPYCSKKSWYEGSLINNDTILENLLPNDILIFDNLNQKKWIHNK